MAVTTAPIAAHIGTTEPRIAPSWRSGAGAGVLAAASTAVAAVALAADVPLEVAGEQIPSPDSPCSRSCAPSSASCWPRRWPAGRPGPRRTFTATTVALTGLSFVPDLVVDASTMSKAVLAATHVVAAAIVIPALAGRLPSSGRSHSRRPAAAPKQPISVRGLVALRVEPSRPFGLRPRRRATCPLAGERQPPLRTRPRRAAKHSELLSAPTRVMASSA